MMHTLKHGKIPNMVFFDATPTKTFLNFRLFDVLAGSFKAECMIKTIDGLSDFAPSLLIRGGRNILATWMERQ